MDRNDYYGGASTSLNLIQVYSNQINGLSFQLIKIPIPLANFSGLILNIFLCHPTALEAFQGER